MYQVFFTSQGLVSCHSRCLLLPSRSTIKSSLTTIMYEPDLRNLQLWVSTLATTTSLVCHDSQVQHDRHGFGSSGPYIRKIRSRQAIRACLRRAASLGPPSSTLSNSLARSEGSKSHLEDSAGSNYALLSYRRCSCTYSKRSWRQVLER